MKPNQGRIVSVSDQGKVARVLKKFESKEIENLSSQPRDLMYVAKLIEHYKNLEERGGHLFKLFQPGPLSIEHYPRHKAFFDCTQTHKESLFMAANRVGKELRITEPVLTPDGWVEIGKLKVGDNVCTPNGTIAPVLGIYDQGVKQLYRVHFNDGTSVDCGLDHKWKCKSPDQRFRKTYTKNNRTWDNPLYQTWSTKSLAEIIDHVGMEPAPPARYSIPVVSSISFPEKEFPIDPYTLGVFLGDGSIKESCSLHSADPEILDLIDWKPTGQAKNKDNRPCQQYYFTGKLDKLRQAGIYGYSCHDKFVPENYKFSNQRLQVLQGLMDTDGYTNGRTSEFVSVSKQLAKDVADIARSLGIRCTLKSKKTSCVYKGIKILGTAWRVNFWTTDVPLFRLSRKANKQGIGLVKKNGSENVIVKIEVIDKDEARCIEVDSEDHTYIVSNYVVTHNSEAGAYTVTCWATGLYPDWWEGRVFDKPTNGWVVGDTNETVRSILQEKLLGSPHGTGLLPAESIDDVVIRPNTGGTVDTIHVKHVSGKFSRIQFKTYQQGPEAFYGTAKDWIWLDEEPTGKDALMIWNQCYVRTMTTDGSILITFTPLHGVTPMIRMFQDDATDLTPLDE